MTRRDERGSDRLQPIGPRAAGIGEPATPSTVTPDTDQYRPNRHERRHPAQAADPRDAPSWLMDYDQAAAYLGITVRHLRHLWQHRQIGAVKVGRLVRFDPADLRAYADRHRVDPVAS